MTNSVTLYPRIGGVDAEQPGIMDLPDVDSSLFVAPTFTGSALNTAHGGIGYLVVDVAGTDYRIPLTTHT